MKFLAATLGKNKITSSKIRTIEKKDVVAFLNTL